MLVGLGVVEQRYRAVLEVLDGASVTGWLAAMGWCGRRCMSGCGAMPMTAVLVDWRIGRRGRRRVRIMPAVIEARVVALRRAHPGWGPARILWQLEREGWCRCRADRRCIGRWCVTAWWRRGGGGRREDYRRWERGRSMELWQMDVMGRVHLSDGRELKVITGIDDHPVRRLRDGGDPGGAAGVRGVG